APVNDLPIAAYESSDPTIATVSATGLVQATNKLGTVTITVRALNTLVATASLHVVGAPARLVVTSGSGQSGVVATTLPVPFTVQVLSAENEGVPGVTVAFQALTAGGAVARATATTDQQGLASTSITLGPSAVGYTFQAA